MAASKNKRGLWLLIVKELKHTIHNAHIYSVISILIGELVKELLIGNEIKIINFGTFYIKKIKPKRIKSVVSGNIMTTRETKALRFRLSSKLAKFLSKERQYKDNVSN